MTPEIRLTAARNAGRAVRVFLDDGRILSGVPERTLSGYTAIRHGDDARPTLFLTADVVDVRDYTKESV